MVLSFLKGCAKLISSTKYNFALIIALVLIGAGAFFMPVYLEKGGLELCQIKDL